MIILHSLTFQCQYPRRQSLNRYWWVLPHQTPLQLDREGVKESDGEKGRGDYSRETINRGTAIIRGNAVTWLPLDKKESNQFHAFSTIYSKASVKVCKTEWSDIVTVWTDLQRSAWVHPKAAVKAGFSYQKASHHNSAFFGLIRIFNH